MRVGWPFGIEELRRLNRRVPALEVTGPQVTESGRKAVVAPAQVAIDPIHHFSYGPNVKADRAWKSRNPTRAFGIAKILGARVKSRKFRQTVLYRICFTVGVLRKLAFEHWFAVRLK
ncbi:MAG TPA: hypothetical protein VGR97_06955 [Candidatus Acidoferrales bacterium]|nr:hypothetical protein [Candidatus Acidoferrales bacterium]